MSSTEELQGKLSNMETHSEVLERKHEEEAEKLHLMEVPY